MYENSRREGGENNCSLWREDRSDNLASSAHETLMGRDDESIVITIHRLCVCEEDVFVIRLVTNFDMWVYTCKILRLRTGKITGSVFER